MPRRRDREGDDELAVRAEINVTSLVDVAFTLLVIFIITAPILQGGIEVNIPRADVSAVSTPHEPFFVTVRADGTVYVGETGVSLEEFQEALPQLVRTAQPEMIYVRGDSAAIYGRALPVIATVFRVAREEGIGAALVAEPAPRRRER
ncbi:MAG: protein TolR [Gemmatimonadetes bacterium]|nr:biopolymer transporter ExbD [Gemmatimonadota bacterium]NIR78237.1 biopolymer transporter ExbD [Gemmatimonadota bacterium]NIT86813.1 biopolymer transporter ExbD [Gemmatimonadota bacterium]NIU30683.1 biopolymer transporter ExbD [Gemmatimonadota bacterium]NIU35485.1 protein TolR [Gemmatimonadota bacterium]